MFAFISMKKLSIDLKKTDNNFLNKEGIYILGFNLNGDSLLILKIQEISNNTYNFILKKYLFDFFNFKFSIINEDFYLFNSFGNINLNSLDFTINLTEVENSFIKYIIYGYENNNLNNLYIYFTIVLKNKKNFHFSFPSNSNNFFWDSQKCLSIKPFCLLINTLSSIKIINFDSNFNLEKKIFDIDNYLLHKLNNKSFQINYYETNILCFNNIKNCFIIFLGVIYFDSLDIKWKLLCHLISLDIFNYKKTLLHSLSKKFETRPSIEIMKKKINKLNNFFLHLSNIPNFNNYYSLKLKTNSKFFSIEKNNYILYYQYN